MKPLSICAEPAVGGGRHCSCRCYSFFDRLKRNHTHDESQNVSHAGGCFFGPTGGILGIISIGDLVKSIIASQDATIAHLQSYIAGNV